MGPRIQNLTLNFKVPALGYLPIKFGTDPWKNEGGVAFFVFFTFFTLAAKPVDLLTSKKVICQATAHGYVISQPKYPSIMGKLPKVRDRQHTTHNMSGFLSSPRYTVAAKNDRSKVDIKQLANCCSK